VILRCCGNSGSAYIISRMWGSHGRRYHKLQPRPLTFFFLHTSPIIELGSKSQLLLAEPLRIQTFSSPLIITQVRELTVSGGIRTPPIPSAIRPISSKPHKRLTSIISKLFHLPTFDHAPVLTRNLRGGQLDTSPATRLRRFDDAQPPHGYARFIQVSQTNQMTFFHAPYF
jgi:hypothetical protein